jgi:hypothetical protein
MEYLCSEGNRHSYNILLYIAELDLLQILCVELKKGKVSETYEGFPVYVILRRLFSD